MLREIVACIRGIVAAPGVAVAVAVLALSACGIKGPLRLPPSSPGAANAAASSPATVPPSSPSETPAPPSETPPPPHEPAERKP